MVQYVVIFQREELPDQLGRVLDARLFDLFLGRRPNAGDRLEVAVDFVFEPFRQRLVIDLCLPGVEPFSSLRSSWGVCAVQPRVCRVGCCADWCLEDG